MQAFFKIAAVAILLSSASFANAGIYIIQVYVSASTDPSCKSGLSIRYDDGEVYCLVPKKSKIKLDGLDGQLVKLGGEYKTSGGQRMFVVAKINPVGVVGTYRNTGFIGALDAASPYLQGAAAALRPGRSVSSPPAPDLSNPGAIQDVPASVQAAGGSSVSGLPQCARTQYVSNGGSLWIENTCGTALTVAFTSDSGNTWGQTDIGAGGRAQVTTMGIGYNPGSDGRVYLFTCPKDSQPVMPNGDPFLARNYKGEYVCHKM